MGILNQFDAICVQFLNIHSQTVDAIGMRMLLGVATIALVWFGAMEALGGVSAGRGMNFAAFIEFMFVLGFAYTLQTYYASPIPGIGYSFRGFILDGTNSLAQGIGNNGINQINQMIAQAQAGFAPLIIKAMMSFYYTVVVIVMQVLLAVFQAIAGITVIFGNVGAALMAFIGPLFIPMLLLKRFESYFWNWFRAFVCFAFYKVIAAAALNILATVLASYYTSIFPLHPMTMVTQLPTLIVICLVSMLTCIAVPLMAAAPFSGSSGGHGSVSGMAALAMRFIG